MNATKTTYQLCSSIFMMLTLLWLTVSMPVVNASIQQQRETKDSTSSPLAGNEEETVNPFGNTTEEKVPPSGFNSLNEFLHEKQELVHPSDNSLRQYKSHIADIYIAYHGELFSPPPNAS